ncbi:hypothetical protein A2U01_0088451 [Trifolium medium]|uniref:Uncharacterized protein n=1 Tax=Trifolium medium TaxID=97028 RepID=A0A392U169_9FABA|nr:hypothetical protein [Trifolium medium]
MIGDREWCSEYGLGANEDYKNFSEVIPLKRKVLDVVVHTSGVRTSRRQFDKD